MTERDRYIQKLVDYILDPNIRRLDRDVLRTYARAVTASDESNR